MKGKHEIPTIRGDKWRSSYRAQVVGILGGRAPRVSSHGRKFFNRNRWTIRILTSLLCQWAKDNPTQKLNEKTLQDLVKRANSERVLSPEIVVAQTPERLTIRTALALVGGADHEAFHSRYSCKRDLQIKDVRFLIDLWDRVPEWNRFVDLLQSWSNVVEDIRIERLGRVEYPGTVQKLHDLQDFILKQETEGEEAARSHGADTAGSLSIAMRTFRDVGLGYATPLQEVTLETYRTKNPEAVNLVLNGPLSGLLRESIALGEEDDVACLRIAFDVITTLYDLSNKTQCPSCGARGSKLTIRPLKDDQGNKVKGMAEITCSVCGWTGTMPLPEEKKTEGQEGADDIRFEDPKLEGFDQDEKESNGSPGENPEDKSSGSQKGASPKESDGEESPQDASDYTEDENGGKGSESSDGDDTGSPSDTDGDDKASSDKSPGNSDDPQDSENNADEGSTSGSDSAEDTEEGDAGSNPKSSGDGAGDEEGNTEGSDNSANDKAKGGTGAGADPKNGDASKEESEGNKWATIADEALEQAGDNLGMLNSEGALEEAINNQQDAENARNKVLGGEALYHPFDTGLDDVYFVRPSRKGKRNDHRFAQTLLQSVKSESSYLRARLRNIIKAAEMTHTVHGVRKGKDLSERFLVHTKVAMMAGARPQRAYWDRDQQQDTSMAAAIVVDESGSVNRIIRDMTRMMIALTEPLDSLGAAVMVSGFRNGKTFPNITGITEEEKANVHRYRGVTHDVFKTWDEPFRKVQYRFANTQALGTTPMADGIQFALDEISGRPEGLRVIWVFTDGDPDSGTTPVIRRQLRLAAEAGILVIGVGVGYGAEGVKTLFPSYVYDVNTHAVPVKIVAKLNELIDSRLLSKRGHRVKKTG